MTAKHTPGPWYVNGDGALIATVEAVASAVLVPVRITAGPGIEPTTATSTAEDARLIAVAPEMLASLKALRSAMDEVLRAVDVAIAKAEGRS